MVGALGVRVIQTRIKGMPRQQGKLPRHAALQGCLKPNVLGAVSVPSPWLLSAGQQSITSSNYNGEVNWHLPSSTGNRCEITKLILQTQAVPDRNLQTAQLQTCLEPCHLPAGEKLLTSALKLRAISSHSQPTLHTLEPAPICQQRNEQKHFLLSSLV